MMLYWVVINKRQSQQLWSLVVNIRNKGEFSHLGHSFRPTATRVRSNLQTMHRIMSISILHLLSGTKIVKYSHNILSQDSSLCLCGSGRSNRYVYCTFPTMVSGMKCHIVSGFRILYTLHWSPAWIPSNRLIHALTGHLSLRKPLS